MERRRYVDKEIIFEEGTLPKDAKNFIYFIELGHIELFIDNFKEEDQHISII